MRIFFICIAMLFTTYANSAWANWDFISKDVNGAPLVYSEQKGKAGSILRLVCLGKEFHFQMAMPKGVRANQTSISVQIDLNRERLVNGSIVKNAAGIPIFVGKDWRGEPSTATSWLVKDMRDGKRIYIGDPNTGSSIDSFPLKGVGRAISKTYRKCP